MNYLLDTCVLSEVTRQRPDEKVLQWLDQIDEGKLFLSVVTLGELKFGVERMPDSTRKTALNSWLNNDILSRFDLRILPVDAETMLVWGALTAQMERSGRPVGVMDGLLVATAVQHNLIVVTRNVSDFMPCGVQIVNPWT